MISGFLLLFSSIFFLPYGIFFIYLILFRFMLLFLCHSYLCLYLFNKWKFFNLPSRLRCEWCQGDKEFVCRLYSQFNQPVRPLVWANIVTRCTTEKFIKPNKINEIRSEIIIIDCSRLVLVVFFFVPPFVRIFSSLCLSLVIEYVSIAFFWTFVECPLTGLNALFGK